MGPGDKVQEGRPGPKMEGARFGRAIARGGAGGGVLEASAVQRRPGEGYSGCGQRATYRWGRVGIRFSLTGR